MQSRVRGALYISFFLIILVVAACTKFDTSPLGADVLPAVDNVSTFADTLDIISSTGIFDDTTAYNSETFHALGHISNDPQFGRTTANVFLQLKPTFYPFRLSANDTLEFLDSVVVTLAYQGTWGDTLMAQQLEVRNIEDQSFADSSFKLRNIKYKPNFTTLLGSATVIPANLNNKIFINRGKDSVTNQIRIKLTNTAYNNALFTSDTSNNLATNAFKNDSSFRRLFNGLAIVASNTQGNGLMYVNLVDAKSRLEVHFRTKNGARKDTTFSELRIARLGGPLFASATANNIERDRAGFPVSTASPLYDYLQTAPGTFTNLSIPRLNTYKDTNKIIHRAYIEMFQVVDNPLIDSLFTPPAFLYLDLKDTTTGSPKWKPIYKDLNVNSPYNPDVATAFFPTNIDFNYFGGRLKYRDDITFGHYGYYNINVSRYIQRLVTLHDVNYQMRLYAPFTIRYPQYLETPIDFPNQIAFGRVRIGSGSHPDPRYRMRLVVIYSKVQ